MKFSIPNEWGQSGKYGFVLWAGTSTSPEQYAYVYKVEGRIHKCHLRWGKDYAEK